MLRLEKRKKDPTIYICVRPQERLWNRSFLIAFGFALGVHLLAMLLFHVGPIQMFKKEMILPLTPVDTQASPNPSNHTQITIISKPHDPLEPRPTLPALPSMPTLQLERAHLLTLDSTEPNHPFELDIQPSLTPPGKKRGIAVRLSGPLAQTAWTMHPPFTPKGYDFAATVHIRVDNKTGKIIWYDPPQKAPQHWVHSLMDTFHFATDPNGVVTTGYIDIEVST